MDALSQVIDEIATAMDATDTAGAQPSRRKRAVIDRAPKGAMPASTHSVTEKAVDAAPSKRPTPSRSERQQARNFAPANNAPPAAAHIFDEAVAALAPDVDAPRRRRTTVRATPLHAASAAPIPAQAGADEAKDGTQPIIRAPRRQSTRAARSGPGTRQTDGGAAGRAILAEPTIWNAPDPESQNDAGRSSLVTQTGSASVRRSGQLGSVTHDEPAATAPIPDGQIPRDIQGRPAIGGDDGAQLGSVAHELASPVVAHIQQLWRMRQRWHRAEKALTLQGKAMCRAYTDGDKTAATAMFNAAAEGTLDNVEVTVGLVPFLGAIDLFEKERGAYEKSLRKLAKQLPVWAWCEPIKGFGELSLAALVGEAGDIGSYKSPSALWKRFGLAVFDGGRQRRVSDADEAIIHGYSPRRRSVMWNVGGAIIGGMGKGPRPLVDEDVSEREDLTEYQKLFIERMRYEATLRPEFRLKDAERKGQVFESYAAHCSARAKRYVEKRLLRHLWAAWRASSQGHWMCDAHEHPALTEADRGQSISATRSTSAPVGAYSEIAEPGQMMHDTHNPDAPLSDAARGRTPRDNRLASASVGSILEAAE